MKNEFRYDSVPVVETSSGKLKGYFYNGAYIFKGVPYAYAERFCMPRENHWEGVKDATSYGFVCPLMRQDTPNGELMVPHRYWPQDEHCQNLNIWTKHLGEEKRPVVVWLHGGGYFAGSSIEQVAYDGFNMCRRGDVVVVSLNHRLNILGYLDLSPFGEKYQNSGNAGHADIVAALRWIQKNIAAFGGDPDNVTLFGQSGGGMKAADMMQIEEADGLYHKALMMSGVGTQPSCTGDGREIVSAILKELGLKETEVEKLETIPYGQLVQAYERASGPVAAKGGYTGGAPLVNSYYKGRPIEYGLRPQAYKIPLMLGTVFGEFNFTPVKYNKYALSEEESMTFLRGVYKEKAEEIRKSFEKAYPGKHITDVLALDRVMRMPTKQLAALHAAGNEAGTYLYNFIQEFPIQHGKAAWHCSDIPFFFANTDTVEVCAGLDNVEELEEKIFGAFMSFVRTGTPRHEALPVWESVTTEEEPTMIFDRQCEVRYHYDDTLHTLIDSVLPPCNLMDILKQQSVQH